MGLFETLAGFLKGAVGNNHDNDPEDTAKNGGVVTVGYGHALRNVEDALKIPFMVRAPMSVKGESGPMSVMGLRPATKQEIEKAYNKVDAIRNGKKENIKAEAFKPWYGKIAIKHGLNDLILPEKEAERLLESDLREHESYVRNKLKKAGIASDNLPPSVRKLILDLQFNNGLGEISRKELFDAIKTRNWSKAKEETRRFKIDPTRNNWRLRQIDDAVKWEENKNGKQENSAR